MERELRTVSKRIKAEEWFPIHYPMKVQILFIISSDFHPSSSPPGEATEVNTAIRRLVGRTSVLPTDKGKPKLLVKRKRRPTTTDITADTAAGFWETKSHSSLGRFLHAPLTLMLKTPQ